MLVVYPFAFLTGAFGFSTAGAITRNRELSMVAGHLMRAGVVAGLGAAIPGLVDYLGSVPPESSARDRAAKHGLLNASALGLFAASWLLIRRSRRHAIPILLQALGSAAMSAAGYMGGTLVYRNQIGVDHRYANAGTWQEDARDEPALRAAPAVSTDGLEIAAFGAHTPVGRPAQPEEIAPAYVFLASDADSSYVTGEVLAIMGGGPTPG